jgi:hypothetical protein
LQSCVSEHECIGVAGSRALKACRFNRGSFEDLERPGACKISY